MGLVLTHTAKSLAIVTNILGTIWNINTFKSI